MNNKKTRRSVYVRTGEPTPIKLTERDRRIFQLVAELGAATATQIHRELFAQSTLKPCTRRLQKLWLEGYLDRLFAPITFAPGLPPYQAIKAPLYCLTKKGKDEVAEIRQMTSPRTPSPLLMAHHHQVNEFRTSLALALKKRFPAGVTLTWVPEQVLRERNALAREKNPSLATTPRLVLADGLASFTLPAAGPQFFFLELDRGTESLWRLVRRAREYVRLHAGDWKRVIHGVPHFRVLFVTTSPDRLMNLRARIAAVGECFNMFWFTTFDEKTPTDGKPLCNITPERILLPIWRKITDGKLHSLIGDGDPDGDLSAADPDCERPPAPRATEDRNPNPV